MSYILPTSTVKVFLSELNKIRRGIHSQFRGDGIYNGDAVLLRLCEHNPVAAIAIAKELEGDISTDDSPDFHPLRVKSFAGDIRNDKINDYIDMYRRNGWA